MLVYSWSIYTEKVETYFSLDLVFAKNVFCLEFEKLEGIWGEGSRATNLNFFYFDICYIPIFLLSKMGSYFTFLSLLVIL